MREFRASDGAIVRASGRRPLDPGLFLLALDERGLAATALGGWDGRRGWLYHVAVRPDRRRHGLGGRMVRTIEERLRERGCPKVNLIEKEL
ncbi:MAG TPA: GNAT family N-acetyltransferase [Candidatus Limnocylindria bacterium]|nr:GNAT family N-acetyltransferase [Candidatus Limnocylindria bacterium]